MSLADLRNTTINNKKVDVQDLGLTPKEMENLLWFLNYLADRVKSQKVDSTTIKKFLKDLSKGQLS